MKLEPRITSIYPGTYVIGIHGSQDYWILSSFDRPVFARKKDCEIAIASLIKAGYITEKHFLNMSDFEFMRICCENLQW